MRLRPNTGDPYCLSLRTGVGYDAGMPSSSAYLNKLNIHRWSGSGITGYIGAIGDGQLRHAGAGRHDQPLEPGCRISAAGNASPPSVATSVTVGSKTSRK